MHAVIVGNKVIINGKVDSNAINIHVDGQVFKAKRVGRVGNVTIFTVSNLKKQMRFGSFENGVALF